MNTTLIIKKLALAGILCAPVPVTYVNHDRIKTGVEHVKKRINPRKYNVRRARPVAPPCVPVVGTGYYVPEVPPIGGIEPLTLRSESPLRYDFGESPGSANIVRQPPQVFTPGSSNGSGPSGPIVVFNPPVLTPPIVVEPPMVPEPATWALLVSGFALVGISLRTRKVTYA
jgi:hypothetical protein